MSVNGDCDRCGEIVSACCEEAHEQKQQMKKMTVVIDLMSSDLAKAKAGLRRMQRKYSNAYPIDGELLTEIDRALGEEE